MLKSNLVLYTFFRDILFIFLFKLLKEVCAAEVSEISLKKLFRKRIPVTGY